MRRINQRRTIKDLWGQFRPWMTSSLGGLLLLMPACDGTVTFEVEEDEDVATTGDDGEPGDDDEGEPEEGVCGDGIVDMGEVCDGDDLNGKTCGLLGLEDGELSCAADCSAFDSSACGESEPEPEPEPEVCGNGSIDAGEICDGTALDGQSCTSLGLPDGELGCADDCSAYDPSGCGAEPDSCGNGVIDEGEACDGDALGGLTCASLGRQEGELGCADDCSAYDPSGCEPVADDCGNGVVDGGEVCDGSALDGQTCSSRGFDGGELGCAADCGAFDESSCTDWAGDCCAANDSAGCEAAACTAAICAIDPFCCNDGWDALCAAAAGSNAESGGACAGTGTCESPEVCGDDSLGDGEVCDGSALDGQSCESQGFAGGGTLACAAGCDAFDTSGCVDWTGECCSDNGTPGCEHGGCTEAVCAQDSFCCDTEWDSLCAAIADEQGACNPAPGC